MVKLVTHNVLAIKKNPSMLSVQDIHDHVTKYVKKRELAYQALRFERCPVFWIFLQHIRNQALTMSVDLAS
jgi:hypothetical protein